MNKLIGFGLVAAGLTLAQPVHATIVEMQTSQGSIQINLFDQHTPKTVANFLGYVERGDYQFSYLHRSEQDFIVQGGGFIYDGGAVAIESQGTVDNEPVLSNVAGTIAMAKRSGNANSASSQWFFNVADNSSNLDLQNGGFTVFGQVIGEGMEVVKAINALPTCSSTPVVDYSTDECQQGAELTANNLVIVNDVIVIDDDPNSAANLTPVENTLIDEPVEPGDDSSSGAFWWLLPLSLLIRWRRA
ncbi:peptidylprolyl isomerase [Pseudoalteromonas ruthenica]|uniref:peptidylprolyl isomerase n=1 Tax=Pseudoalteromonas TaxID=53246 RepID=UPI0011090828|nr:MULTISPECIES: peptidylprolyl isomerase [Pseudoalteromonas]MCG7569343.1 peptidylprolyl isomerase [Pseudoalteromonas sp. CNC9-20]TLX51935.1 peptidylprolyl isomerase [Pseudoalteromonas ruthenica]